MVYPETFEPVWTALVNEKPIKCANTGVEYPAVPKPTFVMFDVSADSGRLWSLELSVIVGFRVSVAPHCPRNYP